jgi:ribosome-binding protein aMBF1 (putative translation factor)
VAEAIAHLKAAAEALRRPAPDRRPPPLEPKVARPPELAGIDGGALRRARAVARLSQRDLAAALDLSRSVLADAEQGRRSVPERVAWWVYRVLRADGGPTDGEAGR